MKKDIEKIIDQIYKQIHCDNEGKAGTKYWDRQMMFIKRI